MPPAPSHAVPVSTPPANRSTLARDTRFILNLNMPDISTKPYLLRAIYEWCTDSGYTPYLAVKVDAATTVPMEYVKKGEIILNISYGATSGLKMDNDAITFRARFNGVSREIYMPVQNVLAIYANENGQGMAFDVSTTAAELQGRTGNYRGEVANRR
jgi:stringent starvation protein B